MTKGPCRWQRPLTVHESFFTSSWPTGAELEVAVATPEAGV